MNKKLLSVLTGLACMVTPYSSAEAVNINPSGLGQVLIYPYYSTRGGNSTLVSVANINNEAKAVRVRFLEGKNSRSVLDFNLYLSPWDIWVAEIALVGDTPHLFVPDSSCTVPYYFATAPQGQPFATHRLDDGYGTDIARTTEGHFEAIEMGILLDIDRDSASSITHIPDPNDPTGTNKARPRDCNQVINAWSTVDGVDGYWLDGEADEDILAPTGGLHGGAAIIDVEEGTLFSYDAIAIEQFFSGDIDPEKPAHYLHTFPGSRRPSLNSGDIFQAQISGSPDISFARGVDAVSALFMHKSLINEFTFEAAANAYSEWVLSAPTRRFYVDPLYGLEVPQAPFTQAINDACEFLNYELFDREVMPGLFEAEIIRMQDPPPANPPPIPTIDLCSSTHVVRFREEDDFLAGTDESEILGSLNVTALVNSADAFYNGWVRVWLEGIHPDDIERRLVGADDVVLHGLPVTGFWVQRFSNGKAANSIVARNYAGLFMHKGTRMIEHPQVTNE